MSAVPPDLRECGDEDARWLFEHGVQRRVRAGEEIIAEGVLPEYVWVVLEGEFRVTSAQMRDMELARARPGDVLGEMPDADRRLPTMSVIAATEGTLLAVRRADLDARTAEEPGFATRVRKVLRAYAVNRLWECGHPEWNALAGGHDPYAGLRPHELIEKLLRGEF